MPIIVALGVCVTKSTEAFTTVTLTGGFPLTDMVKFV